ncbi:glycosyltransferase family 2 protein [Pseudanabaena sp. FACHB-1277]|uniref:Glycosyltransferase family 2 protein n=1 Tax=Pseudanabaena cinerea FACHB-1277 TaxID=2949581 RepID=A0A926US77_9CYAN|nr:glycosyltransferase family 2 protein [Pseudanabaena cinerea]MBD2150266.1 glycosyltransferase family 2 protein [Pseudanabaena cinerea FACHB-1277]
MSHPLLSIVIPTRQRHDTLVYAMASILDQDFKDLELIVMDNFSSPETAEVVASFNDARVAYYRSPQRLSMTENWELGLSYATGEYVSILGDDDAFIPDAFALCESLINSYEFKTISWQPSLYTWSTFIAPWRRDQLSLELNQSVSILDSKFVLGQVYEGLASYTNLPMLYNSFVHKSIINSIKSHCGQYFLSSCPDVYSGIVNAWFLESYFFSVRPLSIAGASHHSTGSSFAYREIKESSTQVNQFLAEVKEDDFNNPHSQLIPTDNLEISIANVLLHAKDKFFPEDQTIQLNIFNLLQSIADQINRNNSTYERTFEYIKALAEKHNISLTKLKIPPKLTQNKVFVSHQGIVERESGFIGLVINCKQANVTNVLQASKLAQSVLPSNESFLDVCRDLLHTNETENHKSILNTLNLRKINLAIFPDWQVSADLIIFELTSIIKTIVTHPLSKQISLLIYVDDQSDLQKVDEIISDILIQIVLDEDLQFSEDTEPSISILENFSQSEWLEIAASLHGIILMTHENQNILNQINIYHQESGKLPLKQIKNISVLTEILD